MWNQIPWRIHHILQRYLRRAIFDLSKTIHKHLENNWSHRSINEFQSFVCKIFSRINGVTGLTPNKVSAKHVRKLVPQIEQKSSKLVWKRNLKAVEKVRIAMEDLPFKKWVQTTLHWRGLSDYKICINQPTHLFAGRLLRRRLSRGVLRARVDKNSVEMDQIDISS